MNVARSTFVRMLCLVWGGWFLVVTLTSIADALARIGALSGFPMVSGDFALIERTTAVYGVPGAVDAVVYVAVIVVEALAAGAFLQAFLATGGDRVVDERVLTAPFLLAAALFGAFLVLDEFFVAPENGAIHWPVFIALVASYAVVVAAHDVEAATSTDGA